MRRRSVVFGLVAILMVAAGIIYSFTGHERAARADAAACSEVAQEWESAVSQHEEIAGRASELLAGLGDDAIAASVITSGEASGAVAEVETFRERGDALIRTDVTCRSAGDAEVIMLAAADLRANSDHLATAIDDLEEHREAAIITAECETARVGLDEAEDELAAVRAAAQEAISEAGDSGFEDTDEAQQVISELGKLLESEDEAGAPCASEEDLAALTERAETASATALNIRELLDDLIEGQQAYDREQAAQQEAEQAAERQTDERQNTRRPGNTGQPSRPAEPPARPAPTDPDPAPPSPAPAPTQAPAPTPTPTPTPSPGSAADVVLTAWQCEGSDTMIYLASKGWSRERAVVHARDSGCERWE
ncbi:MAG: hypothetical protein Q4P33_06795 [Flaviflexus sp.]|nr:hypothetical protein [Flaviflexus sp.]